MFLQKVTGPLHDGRMTVVRCAAVITAAAVLAGCVTGAPHPLPVSVTYAGRMERPGTTRAKYQALLLDLAGVWAGCDADLMRRTLTPDVDFSYPTNRVRGIEAALASLAEFCAVATNRSLYFPADAFYIDVANQRIAAEVQFRVTQNGNREVVNDVWVATIRDGRIAVIKEYLDGRVRHLQAQGVLTRDTDAPFLTPWPPRVSTAPER